MLNLTYLAVLEPGEDGSYGISFPDLPGCFSFADNLAEAEQMAAEAAELHVYGMERTVKLFRNHQLHFHRRLPQEWLLCRLQFTLICTA